MMTKPDTNWRRKPMLTPQKISQPKLSSGQLLSASVTLMSDIKADEPNANGDSFSQTALSVALGKLGVPEGCLYVWDDEIVSKA